MKVIKQIRSEIEKQGGLSSFSSYNRKTRPLGCPMRRMMSDNIREAIKGLSSEELYIAFRLGLIGNNGHDGSIIKNSKN